MTLKRKVLETGIWVWLKLKEAVQHSGIAVVDGRELELSRDLHIAKRQLVASCGMNSYDCGALIQKNACALCYLYGADCDKCPLPVATAGIDEDNDLDPEKDPPLCCTDKGSAYDAAQDAWEAVLSVDGMSEEWRGIYRRNFLEYADEIIRVHEDVLREVDEPERREWK